MDRSAESTSTVGGDRREASTYKARKRRYDRTLKRCLLLLVCLVYVGFSAVNAIIIHRWGMTRSTTLHPRKASSIIMDILSILMIQATRALHVSDTASDCAFAIVAVACFIATVLVVFFLRAIRPLRFPS